MDCKTNDKNLSNWGIRSASDWWLPIYEYMKAGMMGKSILHVDETYAQIIKRSDGKKGQSHAYNWVYRSVPRQGPILVLFDSALSRSRAVLERFTEGYKETIICDGYPAYGKLQDVEFAKCWVHVRHYWLKVDSKNGQIGVQYCDKLYRLEKSFKKLSPSKRRKKRQKHSKPIIDEFFKWIETSWFTGKSALVTAAEYTLKRADGLMALLYDGCIEIDNNAAENGIRPNALGRKI